MYDKLKNIIAMVIFGSIGFFVRFIQLESSVIALSRASIGGVFLLLLMLVLGEKISFSALKKNWLVLLLSGIALGFNWMLLFEAYKHTSVANATLYYYLAPVIITFLSPIIFKERLTLVRIASIILSLAGMAFISGPEILSVGSHGALGVAFGVGAACLYATVVILNKHLKCISAYERTAAQLIVAALSMLPYCLMTGAFGGVVFDPFVYIFVCIVGIVHTGVAYALYFGSVGKLPAQTVALLAYIDPVLALFVSWHLLGEDFTLSGLVGAVLILGSMLVCEVVEGKKK